MLPETLHRQATEAARRGGQSMGEFVRRAVEHAITAPPDGTAMRRRRVAIRKLLAFADDAPRGPRDLATNHDKYIYGERTKKR